MISGLIMLQDCGIVHIGISFGYIVWQIEMCHGARTLEDMASQWVLFHLVTNIFFIFILVLLCMPVQMTAQKISDKIKDCRTWSAQNRPKVQLCLLSHWFEDSHKVAHNTHSSLTCESIWLTTSNYLKIPSKFSCLLAGVVNVLAIGIWEVKHFWVHQSFIVQHCQWILHQTKAHLFPCSGLLLGSYHFPHCNRNRQNFSEKSLLFSPQVCCFFYSSVKTSLSLLVFFSIPFAHHLFCAMDFPHSYACETLCIFAHCLLLFCVVVLAFCFMPTLGVQESSVQLESIQSSCQCEQP
jgi:hypothetical protein